MVSFRVSFWLRLGSVWVPIFQRSFTGRTDTPYDYAYIYVLCNRQVDFSKGSLEKMKMVCNFTVAQIYEPFYSQIQ